MIDSLPLWVDILFGLTCMLTLVLFYFANGRPKVLTLLIILWSTGQSVLAYSGFYVVTDEPSPRFAFVLVPATLCVIYGLLPKQRKWVYERRNTLIGTVLHTVRLPVEITLYGLFIHGMIPELMTFEGRNFDIVMGITAPIVGLLLLNGKVNKRFLLGWNVLGLGLVLFILINGVLSAELPFQQFAFEQPNKGINYFPFVLLPGTIVPIVIWTHLSEIFKLRKEMKDQSHYKMDTELLAREEE